ncbi:hypothetical protein GGF37_003116 [Kickxella alabastrina]|nr:hypothetical protein GGF37_003116 [Kickxella alabastrina]
MSAPLPVLEIRFPSYTSGNSPRCGPKSTLTGLVYLKLAQTLQASCLSLNLVGSERISLAPESANTTANHISATAIAHTTKHRSVKKVYFNQTAILWGDAKLRASNELTAGVHMFHFSCEFPRINYPQSQTTPEYTIKYVLQAKLLNARLACDSTIITAAQPIIYVPETIAPRTASHINGSRGEIAAPYTFCDNATDIEDAQWAFHVYAMGLQQAFRPGETVDLQLRLTGQRTLRKMRFAVIEQTDCFYPQLPDPHEEQLDLGRRLWSAQRHLCESSDLQFERDSSVLIPDLCADHMNAARARGGSTYYAHLHTRLPQSLMVLPETGYLRFTYFAEITLFSNSTWGGHVRRAVMRVPIPVATRVLSGSAVMPKSARIAPSVIGAEPSALLRDSSSFGDINRRGTSSSSAQTVVDQSPYYDTLDESNGDHALRHGRSIVDFGMRLQQLIPRRTPSSLLGLHGGNVNGRSSRPPQRSTSFGRTLMEQSAISVADMLPALPGVAGTSIHDPQSSRFNSPLARSTSPSIPDEPINPATPATHAGSSRGKISSSQNIDSTAKFIKGVTGGFSTTFLIRLREFYHVKANSRALADLINGYPADQHSIIPSAIIRPNATASATAIPTPITTFGSSQQRSSLSSRRNSHMSAKSVSGVMFTSECMRPQIEVIMISYRDPVTSHVSTWSALGSDESRRNSSTPSAASKPAQSSARYSHMSAISVMSSDTVCTAGGQLSFTKELPSQPLLQSNLSLSMLTSTVESPPAVHCRQFG